MYWYILVYYFTMTSTVTVVQDNPEATIGDFLSQERSNQLYQNVQISCANGRLLENQLIICLAFYDIFKDINFACFADSVIIMPEVSIEELCYIFTKVYNQAFKSTAVQEHIVFSEIKSEDVYVKQEPTFENIV